jgi:hypothetical protein
MQIVQSISISACVKLGVKRYWSICVLQFVRLADSGIPGAHAQDLLYYLREIDGLLISS